MTNWSWRDGDASLNPELNLLYEPGNWGDVLKGWWATAVVEALSATHLRVLDPYSGALDYPCTEATRARLAGTALSPFRRLQRAHLKGNRLASTGLLVQEQCQRSQKTWLSSVAEADPARRKSWERHAAIETSAPLDLLPRASHQFDFLLWDPYDFFEQWSHALPRLVQAARKIPVLIYAYNKSPRGVGQMRNYENLRARLQGSPLLCGRVPSDVMLPRAYHEVLLLGPSELLGRLHPTLSKSTARLNRHITGAGCFEPQRVENIVESQRDL